MIGLTSSELYNSIFNITAGINKFELYADLSDEFSFTELKDELEEILGFSDIRPEHVQHEILGPRIIIAYKKLESEKRQTGDCYYVFLMGYARSPFRDFRSFLKIVVGLDEEDIQLISKQYNSNVLSYEIPAGIYSIKNNSETIYIIGDLEGTLQIEYYNNSMKTKLLSTRFG